MKKYLENCAASIANAFVSPKCIKVLSFVVYCQLVNKLLVKTQILSFLDTLLPYIQCLFGFSSRGVKRPILATLKPQYFGNFQSNFENSNCSLLRMTSSFITVSFCTSQYSLNFSCGNANLKAMEAIFDFISLLVYNQHTTNSKVYSF